ncbi:Protein nuclear fusion defective 2 [Vitis vinifera]|uniref:Protein nuclear fusion defective 2 n=1 Tax=Vitis vinifera TaxID=29760 RepID=A0A438EYL6_VITVI|nr:Protein nuclear fusion defective 2 [Vitis vinifera]
MTHSSFSEENNKALSILGASTIETSVSLQYLKKDIEASAKDLNRRISEISQVESSCAVDAMRLGLQKVIRVSPKTNASTPAVVCGAFRAIFGAIAMDTGKSDDAGKVFWSVHGSEVGGAAALKYLYILPMVILKQTDPWEHVSVRLHQVFVVLCLGNIVMEVC